MPEWLEHIRASATEAFSKSGLPHRKVEDWKYTSLKLLEARSHRLLEESAAPGQAERGTDALDWPAPLTEDSFAVRLLNGRPETNSPAPDSFTVLPLEAAIASEDTRAWVREMLQSLEVDGPARAFSALNTSMLGPGLVIHVPRGTDGGTLLLQWAFEETPPAMLFNTRVLIRLEEGASLTVIDHFESAGEHAHGLNRVVQADVGRGAKLHHLRLQDESDEAVLITRTECAVHKNGSFHSCAFDWGGALVRQDSYAGLLEPGATADIDGAFILDGEQHLDHHVFVDHVSGNTRSGQFFRGVLSGKSRGVFNGKARIQKGADGSSVRQSNANLLLSRMAEIDTKPELEIYADEVEASHGATVGQLDEDAVFYLRSRGLSEEEARGMLTGAFCKAVLDQTMELPASLAEKIAHKMENALGTLVESE